MNELLEAVTTVETAEDAEQLADLLISNRLAACVQIHGPITSIYRWKDAIQRATEWRLTIKSTLAVRERLQQFVLANHPYETPELLFIRVEASAGYAEWLAGNVDSKPS